MQQLGLLARRDFFLGFVHVLSICHILFFYNVYYDKREHGYVLNFHDKWQYMMVCVYIYTVEWCGFCDLKSA